MQALFPSASASSNADLPRESLTPASAPRSSSSFTTSALPRQAAVHSAFLTPSSHVFKGKSPLLGTSSMATPRSSKNATTSVLPQYAAFESTDRPVVSAPALSSASRTGMEDIAAPCSKARYIPPSVFAFGSAPRDSRSWTISRSFEPVARLNAEFRKSSQMLYHC